MGLRTDPIGWGRKHSIFADRRPRGELGAAPRCGDMRLASLCAHHRAQGLKTIGHIFKRTDRTLGNTEGILDAPRRLLSPAVCVPCSRAHRVGEPSADVLRQRREPSSGGATSRGGELVSGNLLPTAEALGSHAPGRGKVGRGRRR